MALGQQYFHLFERIQCKVLKALCAAVNLEINISTKSTYLTIL